MDYSQMFFLSNNASQEDDDGSSDEECDYEEQLNKLVQEAKSDVIPEQSRNLYEKQYNKFVDWCLRMKIKKVDDNCVLGYFQYLSKSYVATSLWYFCSRLRAMLKLKENIDICKNLELMQLLKKQGKQHQPKKAKVFTTAEVSRFLDTAPSEEFLVSKVVLVLGLHGCLRSKELLDINMNNVKQEGSLYHVKVFVSKTKTWKSFVTSAGVHPIIEKYIKVRPEGMEERRFLLQYRNNKCIRQHVGKRTISSVPKKIAEFLNLSDPEKYTGHAIRRTSATLFVDEGGDMLGLKRFGGWKSNTVAEGYVDASEANKRKASEIMSHAIGVDAKRQKTENNVTLCNNNLNAVHHGPYAPSTSEKGIPKINDQELEDIGRISQEEYDEVLSQQFPEQQQIQQDIFSQELSSVTQAELREIVSTDFNMKKIATAKQNVYIIKPVIKQCNNCTFNFCT